MTGADRAVRREPHGGDAEGGRRRGARPGAGPTVVVGLVGLIALVLPAAVGDAYHLHVLILTLLFGFLGVGWNILGGYAGQVCFIQSLFVGIGAYTSTLLFGTYGVTPWIGMLVGGLVSAAVALGIGALTFRYGLREVFFALATMAFVEMARYLALNLKVLGGAEGLYVPITRHDPWNFQFLGRAGYYYTVLALLATGLGVTATLARRRVGYYLRAIRENEAAAQAVGVDVVRYKQVALATSAFLLALGGTFYAQYVTFIDPYSLLTWEIAGQILIVAVVGGAGTLFGPVVGAAFLVPVGELVRVYLGKSYAGVHMVVYGAVLMLVILFVPGGLAGPRLRELGRRLGWRGAPAPADAVGLPVEAAGPSPEGQWITRPGAPLMVVRGLSRRFGGVQAVNGLSFEVRGGEILGIIGPNGAGKTTTFAMMSGFLRPTAGSISLDGRDVVGLRPHQLCARGIARTFQIVEAFPELTALETVTVASFARHRERRGAVAHGRRILERVGLQGRESTLSQHMTLAELKRLEIAKALATEPRVVLLDEVGAGLTPTETARLVDLIRSLRKQGLTFVIIEHVMEMVMSLSDRIVVLHHGEMIAEGRPEEITQDPAVVQAYLGEELTLADG